MSASLSIPRPNLAAWQTGMPQLVADTCAEIPDAQQATQAAYLALKLRVTAIEAAMLNTRSWNGDAEAYQYLQVYLRDCLYPLAAHYKGFCNNVLTVVITEVEKRLVKEYKQCLKAGGDNLKLYNEMIEFSTEHFVRQTMDFLYKAMVNMEFSSTDILNLIMKFLARHNSVVNKSNTRYLTMMVARVDFTLHESYSLACLNPDVRARWLLVLSKMLGHYKQMPAVVFDAEAYLLQVITHIKRWATAGPNADTTEWVIANHQRCVPDQACREAMYYLLTLMQSTCEVTSVLFVSKNVHFTWVAALPDACYAWKLFKGLKLTPATLSYFVRDMGDYCARIASSVACQELLLDMVITIGVAQLRETDPVFIPAVLKVLEKCEGKTVDTLKLVLSMK